jgi:hypothetical protein
VADQTKTVDGKALPKEKFAYVGDPQDPSTWHLPIDDDHIGSAVKMFGHEQHVPASAKGAVARKIAAEAKKHGIDTTNFEQKYCQSSDHADFGNGWVEIFRAGNYGDKGKFDESDLDNVIQNYDPSFHEAPACVGHPRDDSPAYGWVSRLMRKGATLLAKFKDVDPAFEEAVKARRFPKRSAAFYVGSDGRISGLRHVGFLGGQPPEVKGLKNLSFDDAGRRFTEVDFGEEEAMDKSVKDQIKEFFAEMFGGKPGESKTFSEADVQTLVTKAVEAATKPFSDQVTELKTQLQQQTAKFSERETAIATSETKQRAIDAENKLKSTGRWVPAFEKMGLGLVFAELAKSTGTVEFTEGDKKLLVSPLDLLVKFMEGLPRIVPDGRTYDGKTPAGKSGVRFTEGRNAKADPNSIALNDAAMARAKEKKISFGEALDQIVQEQPELAIPGGARAGEV